MPIHLPGSPAIHATWRQLQVFAVVSLAAAACVLAIPGPATEATGIAAFTLLGAVALLAGHRWGAVVATTGSLLAVGQLLPSVLSIDAGTSPTIFIALALCLPGSTMFAMTIPTTADTLVGQEAARHRRTAELAVGVAGFVALVAPVVGA